MNSAVAGEHAAGCIQRARILVPERNPGAGLQQALGDGGANAARATRNYGVSVLNVDVIHGMLVAVLC